MFSGSLKPKVNSKKKVINMAVSDNMFRLKLDLKCAFPHPDDHDLVWLCVDQSKTTTIKELARFIRAKYGLDEKCELYLEDAWLPPQEPIQTLRDKDLVRVISSRKGSPDPASCIDDSVRPVQDESPVTKRKKKKRRTSEGSADDTALMLDKGVDTSSTTAEWPQSTQDCEESFEETAPVTENEDVPTKCKDYSYYPRLLAPPKVGAIIAFKVVDLDYYYRATMSEYKEGKVVDYDSTDDLIRIELRNAEAKKNCSEMLELEEPQDLPPVRREVELPWTELHEPVMLS